MTSVQDACSTLSHLDTISSTRYRIDHALHRCIVYTVVELLLLLYCCTVVAICTLLALHLLRLLLHFVNMCADTKYPQYYN